MVTKLHLPTRSPILGRFALLSLRGFHIGYGPPKIPQSTNLPSQSIVRPSTQWLSISKLTPLVLKGTRSIFIQTENTPNVDVGISGDNSRCSL